MPSLENSAPRRLWLFLKEYHKSVWFAYSSPISSVFWLFTVFFGSSSSNKLLPNILPFLTEAWVYYLLVIVAIGTYIVPAGVYWWKNRPFHVVVEWNPIEPDSTDHRLKRKNSVVPKTGEDRDAPTAKVLVTIIFDNETEEYKLRFNSTGSLSVVPQYAPGNSVYDEENNVIVCDNVESSSFYFPLEITKDKSPSGVLDQRVYMEDALNGDMTILDIEVV
ncbi:hypothetical protein [Halococcoides cellulosivorans]|uniref:hypothetical protein n=1 Tax=Halococcoides cellulosivorans TaxID=1679096 RepID=UPI00131F382B|nr:hypothetical protein [Halococcoides cellulosivorans]